MDINIALLLATLSTILQQGDALPSEYYPWYTYNVHQDDCPLVQQLWNPFTRNIPPSLEEICLCLDRHGERYACPKIDTHTNPCGYFNNFLLCWRNIGERGTRYTLSFPGRCGELRYRDGDYLYRSFATAPLFRMKNEREIFEKLRRDPRCNLELHKKITQEKRERKIERAKERKRLYCKQKSAFTQFMKYGNRYKKNNR